MFPALQMKEIYQYLLDSGVSALSQILGSQRKLDRFDPHCMALLLFNLYHCPEFYSIYMYSLQKHKSHRVDNYNEILKGMCLL